jgi:hypothetical protein
MIAPVAQVDGLAADDQHVYWMDGGEVFASAPGAPVDSLALFAAADAEPTGNRLLLANGQLIVAASSGVFGIDVAAKGPPVKLFDAIERTHAMARTGSTLYAGRDSWIDSTGALFSGPIQGGPVKLEHPAGYIWDLQADGETVFWSDAGTYDGMSYNHDGRLGRIDASGETVLVDSMSRGPLGIGLDSQYLYWADYGGGAVRRIPRSGGASELVTKVPLPRNIVPTPEGIYITSDHPQLFFLSPGATEPECIAELAGVPGEDGAQLSLTSDSVYVETTVPGHFYGAIYRAPRRGH